MTAQILDGKAYAKTVLTELHAAFESEPKPGLAIISTDDDEASKVYVRNKIRTANEFGINTEFYQYDGNQPVQGLIDFIKTLNNNKSIHGIIVQLPLADNFIAYQQVILDTIDPDKDVDGLSTISAGRLITDQDCFVPCTPYGVVELLRGYKIPIESKHVVIVGRSNLVGLPLANLMIHNHATVTVCHSFTQNLEEITRQADILVSATGCLKLIKANMVKPGAVVVDVGINRDQNGKLCGDVDFDGVKEVASWITPVPGGIGPMTVASLMRNVYLAHFFAKP